MLITLILLWTLYLLSYVNLQPQHINQVIEENWTYRFSTSFSCQQVKTNNVTTNTSQHSSNVLPHQHQADFFLMMGIWLVYYFHCVCLKKKKSRIAHTGTTHAIVSIHGTQKCSLHLAPKYMTSHEGNAGRRTLLVYRECIGSTDLYCCLSSLTDFAMLTPLWEVVLLEDFVWKD